MLRLESQFRNRYVRASVEFSDLRKFFSQGPFASPHQDQIFAVNDCLLAVEDLIHLWRQGKLNPAGVRAFSESQQPLLPARRTHRPFTSQSKSSAKLQVKSVRAGRS